MSMATMMIIKYVAAMVMFLIYIYACMRVDEKGDPSVIRKLIDFITG